MTHLLNANSFHIPLADESVNMVASSPPYYGLRLYEADPIVIGGDPLCKHEWTAANFRKSSDNFNQGFNERWGNSAGQKKQEKHSYGKISLGQSCIHCGAWQGHLGNEPLHDCLAWARNEPPCNLCFVCHIRMVAAEIWRVLHPSGTFWLNLGDSYVGGKGKSGHQAADKQKERHQKGNSFNPEHGNVGGHGKTRPTDGKLPGLKPKDLIGIPWRVALALQADGWYLRSDIIWAKGVSFCPGYNGSCMPESVADRPTKGHEYVFVFSKRQKYFYDVDAVREPLADTTLPRARRGVGNHKTVNGAPGQPPHSLGQPRPNIKNTVVEYAGGGSSFANGHSGYYGPEGELLVNPDGRQLRSVWTINPQGWDGAHFAVWPEDLVEPMIKLGTSEKGVCPACRSPWKRVTKKKHKQAEKNPNPVKPYDAGSGHKNGTGPTTLHQVAVTESVEWRPTCKCPANEPVPAIILDPFFGSGTTGLVARRLGRRCVGLDLSFNYLVQQAKERTGLAQEERFEKGTGVKDGQDYAQFDLPLFKMMQALQPVMEKNGHNGTGSNEGQGSEGPGDGAGAL